MTHDGPAKRAAEEPFKGPFRTERVTDRESICVPAEFRVLDERNSIVARYQEGRWDNGEERAQWLCDRLNATPAAPPVDQREAFEKWYVEAYGTLKPWRERDGSYPYDSQQKAWDAWQASRPSGAVPEGWRLVPVEPTREMWAAAGDKLVKNTSIHCHHDQVTGDVWSAMLSAAPTPPTSATTPAERAGLTRDEHLFLLAIGLIIRTHGKPEDADRLLRITRRLTAPAQPADALEAAGKEEK